MTDRCEEIRKRAEAASEGPWERDESRIEGNNGGAVAYVSEHASMHTIIARGEDYSSADAAFIAHSRTDIPYLLSELDAARAEIERLKQRSEFYRHWCDKAEEEVRRLRGEGR